ncbi:MAG: TM2 domain-containing protein [Desulfuromonadaceae bacterium]|nr:TM2 domain-containing protein [Desulfuromonadaceae bacterium]
MPLIPCPECFQEISDRAISCPKCGFPIKDNKQITNESPAMIWDSEDGVCICVKCPKCYKSSIINKTTARKTDTGYSLDGEGTCSCGLTFDKIERNNTLNSSPVFMVNQPSRRSTAGLLALLLGGIGVHHFYLGRPVAGIFNILFCWTFIPAILALVTAIQYFSMTDDVFNRTVDKTHRNFKG